MTEWEPGDALYDRETSVYLARQMAQLLIPFPDGMLVHPMAWTAGGVPGPWSWLQPAALAEVMAA